MASEVGVLPVDPKIVKEKGRLQPGRMFLVDFQEGRLIPDDELKNSMLSSDLTNSGSKSSELRSTNSNQRGAHGFNPETLLARCKLSVTPPRRCSSCCCR